MLLILYLSRDEAIQTDVTNLAHCDILLSSCDLLQAKKSDALRIFIMHHYGGLYLDFDIECFKPADDSLQQFDLILQGTGNEGFNNAVMASVPGKST